MGIEYILEFKDVFPLSKMEVVYKSVPSVELLPKYMDFMPWNTLWEKYGSIPNVVLENPLNAESGD